MSSEERVALRREIGLLGSFSMGFADVGAEGTIIVDITRLAISYEVCINYFIIDSIAGAVLNEWWWVLPPGFLIMLAAITFVFIALGLEPIVNPKLQER